MLEELTASRQSRKRAGENLQEIRSFSEPSTAAFEPIGLSPTGGESSLQSGTCVCC
jgi:hypothetical protein